MDFREKSHSLHLVHAAVNVCLMLKAKYAVRQKEGALSTDMILNVVAMMFLT
jgi:hypothetical protein